MPGRRGGSVGLSWVEEVLGAELVWSAQGIDSAESRGDRQR